MNVPAIRKGLEQLDRSFMAFQNHGAPHPVTAAVIRVGMLACDELDEANHVARNAPRGFPLEGRELAAVARLSVIVDILREAGVEVSE